VRGCKGKKGGIKDINGNVERKKCAGSGKNILIPGTFAGRSAEKGIDL